MKILRIIRSLNPRDGGPSEGIRQITPHLNKHGISTTVLTLDQPDSSWLGNDSFKAIGLGPVVGKYGYLYGLETYIKKYALHYDVVIIHGIWQYHSIATWRALRGTNIPYFVYTHGMLDPWFKRTHPLKHLKKWAYWPWGDYQVLRNAYAVLFTTQQERLLASKSFWLYSANEIVVSYGTSAPPDNEDHQRQVFLKRFPHLNGKRVLLFMSRIHPKKGVDLLIEAFSSIAPMDQNLALVIAGPDQIGLQSKLIGRSDELGISNRITWAGMLSGELKWGAFRCAELFCLPSHQENFGIVVAEALACGLPVTIAKPVNIATDVAEYGAGIVHSDTASGTEEGLKQWLNMSSEEKSEMGERGRELFAKRFNFVSVAKNLIPVLEGAVQARLVR